MWSAKTITKYISSKKPLIESVNYALIELNTPSEDKIILTYILGKWWYRYNGSITFQNNSIIGLISSSRIVYVGVNYFEIGLKQYINFPVMKSRRTFIYCDEPEELVYLSNKTKEYTSYSFECRSLFGDKSSTLMTENNLYPSAQKTLKLKI